jgi:murein DD-endopeptidase MepM/ murein hydrolase activator NlpD
LVSSKDTLQQSFDPRNVLSRSLDAGRLEEDDFIINDVALRIPSTEIYVEKRAYNETYQTLRTRKSRKTKSGNSLARVAFSTVFKLSVFEDQYNLIRLVAGLRATPFCAVWNPHLDRTLGHPGRERSSEVSSLQPIMLGLTSMSFETMGHEGKPDCCRGTFDFLWFNYLPYAHHIAFKKGDTFNEPGYPWESRLWKAFYSPYAAELQEVKWPHSENLAGGGAGRLTVFGWREFLMIPKGDPIATLAAKELADALNQRPAEVMRELDAIVKQSTSQDDPNPQLLTDGALDTLYRKLVRNGAINPNSSIRDKIEGLSSGAITQASQDVLFPVIRKMYGQDQFQQQDLQRADVAGKILAERAAQSESLVDFEGGGNYSEIIEDDTVKLLDQNIEFGKKIDKKKFGGFQLFGKKRFYKILHQSSPHLEEAPDAIIQRIIVSFQNSLTTIPLASHLYPTLQHMGSVDAQVVFVINARSSGVHDINAFYDSIEAMSLRFRQIPAGLTNLYIQNDFLSLFGLNEFITERLATSAIPDQPARSIIELELSEAGLTSKDKEDDPEVIKQEFVTGSIGAFKKAWKTINERLAQEKNGKGHTPVQLEYYFLKTVKVKRDGSQDLLASIADESRNAYNNFLERIHKAVSDRPIFTATGGAGAKGAWTNEFNRGSGGFDFNGTVWKLLNLLSEEDPYYGYIPGFNKIKKTILERAKARGEKVNIQPSAEKDGPVSKEIQIIEAKKIAQNLGVADERALVSLGLETHKLDPSKQKEAIAKFQKKLDEIGLNRYQTQMREIFQKAINNKDLPELKPLQEIVEKDFLEKGRPAYPDFKKQLTSIASLVEETNIQEASSAILKFNPDCYFWYPHLDGSSFSLDLSAIIDPQLITQAKIYSLDIWDNAQNNIEHFFSKEYCNSLKNPKHMGPYNVLMHQSKGKIAPPLYQSGNIGNSTINTDTPICKSTVCDPHSKVHTNWYPQQSPQIQSNQVCYHSTDIRSLWNGVDTDPGGHSSFEGSAATGRTTVGKTKSGMDNPNNPAGTAPVKSNPPSNEKPPFELIWPINRIPTDLPEGYLFGVPRKYRNGGQGIHGGIDMPHKKECRAPYGPTDGVYGMPVKATADGTITAVWDASKRTGAGGVMMQITHKNGWKTEYSHISPLDQFPIGTKGIRVKTGQTIAKIDRSGNKNSATHLHFQIRTPKGQVIDPLTVLPPMKKMPQTKVGNIPYTTNAANNVTTTVTSPLMRSIQELEKGLLKGQSQSLMRAYPTFKLYFIEDDSGERRKYAFDDFFSYSAVQSIRVVRSRKIAADLCEIYLSNTSGVLSDKKFSDTYYEGGEKKTSAPTESLSPMKADTVLENPISSLLLQIGIQINLRMGYMNDPDDLETVFNGVITEIEFSENEELIRVLAQSYAIELMQDIKGFEKPQQKSSFSAFGWNFWGFSQNATTGRILEEMLAEPEVLHFGRWDPTTGTGSTYARELLTQRWTFQPQPADDNIFAPSPKQDLNDFGDGRFFKDLKYVIYRITIWDIFQEMALRHPNFIAAVVPYEGKGQQRNTAFFGLPNQLYFARDPKPIEQRADEKLKEIQRQAEKKVLQTAIGNQFEKKGLWGKILRNFSYGVGRVVGGTPETAASLGQDLITNNWATSKLLTGTDYQYNLAHAATNVFFRKYRLARSQDAGYIAPFRNYHLLTSSQHIIHNGIKANNRDVMNTVAIKYNKEISLPTGGMGILTIPAEETFTLKLDNALPTEDIQTLVGEFVNVTHTELAKRYALSLLCQSLKDVYKGEIITIGIPSVKPYDICYLFDEQTDMIGAFEVEEVQQLMSQQDGFRTSIKPDMLVQASEWSLLGSAEAIGMVIEGIIRKSYGGIWGPVIAYSLLPNVMKAGLQLFGGFLAQKIINFTQLAQPIVMAPMTHHGKIFAGGIPTRKIPTSTWCTADSKWSSTIDAGYYDWIEQIKAEAKGWIRNTVGGNMVGQFWNNGGDTP